jgi:hypothetical protein
MPGTRENRFETSFAYLAERKNASETDFSQLWALKNTFKSFCSSWGREKTHSEPISVSWWLKKRV